MIPEDFQAADDLDLLLTARQSGQEPPPLPNLPAAEAAFATELLRLAEELRPDTTFAAVLEGRLRAAAARRPGRLTAPTGATRLRDWLTWVSPAFKRSLRYPRRVAVAALAIMLAVLMTVTPVRAAILFVLQIGAARIFTIEPTASGVPTSLAPNEQEALSSTAAIPAPTRLGPTLDLAGETTLAEAQRKADFPIRLPSYPTDLGPPDRVYLQDMGGTAVILVWVDRAHPDQVRLSLHELGPEIDVEKNQPPVIEQTTVNGQPAVWTSGPYMLEVQPSTQTEHRFAARRLLTGHTLLWAAGRITYRLETDQPLETAVRIAESLR